MGSHCQHGQNRPPAANQLLTKHLTGCLTENAHRNKTVQVNIDGQPALLSKIPAATTETTGDHSPRSRQMNTRTSTNEQIARKECPQRLDKNDQSLGTFLNDYFTAPARRRPRLRRPGHRPWRSPQASCRCGRHRPRTPVRHPRRRRRHGPQDENPRQPSRATDDPP